MIARLFSNKTGLPPTAFESCVEFAPLNCLIIELQKEESILKTAAVKQGVGSIDEKKYQLISKLVEQINSVLKNFNENYPYQKDIPSEIKELSILLIKHELIRNICKCILNTIQPDFEHENPDPDVKGKNLQLLLTHRNNQQTIVVSVAHYTVLGTAIIASGVTSLLGIAGVTIAANYALRAGESAAGVNQTTCCKIIINLGNTLDSLDKTICNSIQITKLATLCRNGQDDEIKAIIKDNPSILSINIEGLRNALKSLKDLKDNDNSNTPKYIMSSSHP